MSLVTGKFPGRLKNLLSLIDLSGRGLSNGESRALEMIRGHSKHGIAFDIDCPKARHIAVNPPANAPAGLRFSSETPLY